MDSFNTLTHKNEAGLIFFTETPLASYIFSRGAPAKNSKNTDSDLMKLSTRGFFSFKKQFGIQVLVSAKATWWWFRWFQTYIPWITEKAYCLYSRTSHRLKPITSLPICITKNNNEQCAFLSNENLVVKKCNRTNNKNPNSRAFFSPPRSWRNR